MLQIQADLREVALALAEAFDWAGGDNALHGPRVAMLAIECGRRLGLAEADLGLLFHAALLRDCAVSSRSEFAELHRHLVWPGSEAHCQRGHALLVQFPFLAKAAGLVRHHHTPWPELARHNLPVDSTRLANLVFIADRANALIAPHLGPELAAYREPIRAALRRQRDILFEPDIVDAFMLLSARDSFWYLLDPARTQRYSLEFIRRGRRETVGFSALRQFATLVAAVTDARGGYPKGHAQRVAHLARWLGERVGLTLDRLEQIELAGLLRGVGRLRAPDAILAKNGPLSRAEHNIMSRCHADTWRVLSRIEGLREVALCAAYNPGGLNDGALPAELLGGRVAIEARLAAAAELLLAMAEPRAWRPALNREQARQILRRGNVLDAEAGQLLLAHFDAAWARIATGPKASPQPSSRGQTALPDPVPTLAPQDALSAEDEERLIAAVLAGGVKIPPLPQALIDLGHLAGNENAGAREYAEILGRDGALAGAVFRVARSPVFGLHARVDSLEGAITVLGLRTSLAVARSEAAQQALSDPRHARALSRLWDRVSAVAGRCAELVGRLRPPGLGVDQAYTAGMFHDCGIALLCKRYPDYATALSGEDWPDILALDRQFRTSHAVVGQTLGRSWQLPPETMAAIRHHHDIAPDGLDDRARALLAILQFALFLEATRLGEDTAAWTGGQRLWAAQTLGRDAGEFDTLAAELGAAFASPA